MATTTLPTVMGPSGLVPQTPSSLRQQLLNSVATTNPDYTANLPGSLIEDISSTDVGAIVLMDQARVDAVNSVSPQGANDFILAQLGEMIGITQNVVSNTSVNVIISGPSGYVIPVGFMIGDSLYTYIVQDGGVIGANGQTPPLFCLASSAGSWEVPAGTVTVIKTSIPNNVPLRVSNPSAGIPGVTAETSSDFRSRVMQAQRASAQGMPSFVRTLLRNVPGVQDRLISVQQQPGGGWKVICGGGDIYAVGYAIFKSVLDISTLQPSVIQATNITSGSNAVVTTNLNHGLTTGQIAYISGITQGMTGINNVPLNVTVIDDKTFSTGVNSTLYGTYESGGVLSPNYRNNAPKLFDYPDTYVVNYISPPSQNVAVEVTWSTDTPGYVNIGAVQQLAQPAVAAYINSVYVGKPLNLYDMQDAFREAVASIVPPDHITNLQFQVSVNGQGVAFEGGVLYGDPESYFLTPSNGSQVSVVNQ